MRTNSSLDQVLGLNQDESNQVSIGIASPEVIASWSRGEVKNPETINYRSFKPEKGGLFCERIFGPTKDWECNCGKYKRVKHKNIVCDRCGVEVTHSRVRRERMGHIELAVPVTHIWFYKCLPSRIGLLLDMTVTKLERVIYYEDWIITDPGDTPLEYKQILIDSEFREARELYGDNFKAGMGAEAIKELLKNVKIDELQEELREEMRSTRSKAKRSKIAKRLRITEGFSIDSDNFETHPEWMVLDVIPVIPPDLRPLVPLEGGRFASSDLNDLYRRVINRNNRLKNLLRLKTPEVIIRNEKRMLQESVDALLDNGRHGRPVTGTGRRPLKSLSDMLKGKQGRFRQNLLGKRVDYSGRSVIVVGPELKLHQCGLPKEMAMVLFEPFIIAKLKVHGFAHTVRSAKKIIERRTPEVWDILEEVTKGHPVLLNRAPTLHRLSIQAFDPILIEGKAIRLHPLVCAAYNADFDGDQMAVHVQLSNEAQMEAKMLMMAPLNIFSPANGKPMTVPSQDITLGIYYLTYHARKASKALKKYSHLFEALLAYDKGILHIHDLISVKNPCYGKDTLWGDKERKFIDTTIGRCLFNEVWEEELGFFNDIIDKKTMSNLLEQAYSVVGREKLVVYLDKLKEVGYKYATESGFSIGMTDMIIPEKKNVIIEEASKKIDEVRKQRQDGIITDMERYNKCIDTWTQANNDVASELHQTLQNNDNREEINPIYAMLDSGARGSRDQIRQLAGMRGLMARPSGEIIERPIKSNFREGLTVLEYFISTHGARKGLADTALKTADSGYMTRKLVDVAQDVVCSEFDCHSVKGITVSAIKEGDQEKLPLRDRIIGRFAAEDIENPLQKGSFLVRNGEEITEKIAATIEEFEIETVSMRSVLTCEAITGVCTKCYGRNLATGDLAKKGSALGIIAAQSIGEPGTQLTMRTFHVGGTATASYKKPILKARRGGKIKLLDARTVRQEDGKYVVLNKHAFILLENDKGVELEKHSLNPGTILQKEEGEAVKKNEVYAKWDPYNVPIITEYEGIVEYKNMVEGVTLRTEEEDGTLELTIMDHQEVQHPQIIVVNEKGDVKDHHSLPAKTTVLVAPGDKVKAGIILAKTPREVAKTKDITGGLPRVTELLEARTPKEAAEIAKIDGVVELGKMSEKSNKRTLLVRDIENGQEEKHLIPSSKRIVVFNGDFVKKGQSLTDGAVVPKEILDVCGAHELQEYLVNEVQEVYRLQGVEINDKHIEIIVRQMLRKVKVTDAGDTEFVYGEQVHRDTFSKANAKTLAEGGQPAEAEPLLLGITKSALGTDSFISAASFQDTTRILADAATMGQVDNLRGFKENVILGQLIPAGTGHDEVRNLQYEKAQPEEDITETLDAKFTEEHEKAKTFDEAKALLDL
ncbi:MAG: DNA-directed RNA polymerase subunit beta' [Verrucomicrobiota bacterium]|nr:DNA-directed RNA polymerase subunit beta' [Verrucomicrobiota bacterium]